MEGKNYQLATFAAGCFWCVEAIFRELKGVNQVISGYSGGKIDSPDYEEVSAGNTGHAEAIQIMFDPSEISYAELLDVFWHTHDPTTQNQQGADVGTQYRSVIFFHTDEQKQLAEKSRSELEKAKEYVNPIVTEITQFTNFFPAEDYHQEFYSKNRGQMYCSLVIDPKIQKLRESYSNKLKEKVLLSSRKKLIDQ